MNDLNISVEYIVTLELGMEPSIIRLKHVEELYKEGMIDCVMLTDADLNLNPKVAQFLNESKVSYVIIDVMGKDPYGVILEVLTKLPECKGLISTDSKPQSSSLDLLVALIITNIILLMALVTVMIRAKR